MFQSITPLLLCLIFAKLHRHCKSKRAL